METVAKYLAYAFLVAAIVCGAMAPWIATDIKPAGPERWVSMRLFLSYPLSGLVWPQVTTGRRRIRKWPTESI